MVHLCSIVLLDEHFPSVENFHLALVDEVVFIEKYELEMTQVLKKLNKWIESRGYEGQNGFKLKDTLIMVTGVARKETRRRRKKGDYSLFPTELTLTRYDFQRREIVEQTNVTYNGRFHGKQVGAFIGHETVVFAKQPWVYRILNNVGCFHRYFNDKRYELLDNDIRVVDINKFGVRCPRRLSANYHYTKGLLQNLERFALEEPVSGGEPFQEFLFDQEADEFTHYVVPKKMVQKRKKMRDM